MTKINCCYGCEKREVGCHSSCESYIAERKLMDAEKEKRKKTQEKSDALWDTYLRGLKNMKNVRAKYNEQRKRK